MKRVVVTGLGMVSPLACGVEATWKRLLAGECGGGASRELRRLRPRLPDRRAGAARRPRPDAFNPDEWMEPKEQRKVDDFIVFAIAAATQALEDADWAPKTYEDQIETGVLIGSGIGGLGGIAETSITLHEKGPRRVSPFFIPGRLINLAGGQVSIRHGLKGPNHAVVTACSTGAHAIGDAARLIALGDAEVMVAGGAESAVNRLAHRRLRRLQGAVDRASTTSPKQASRPYDRDRDGFVMGEGAGCVVLEELEHAKARGARIYAEVIGYGLSGDAYHITAPAPDGDGAFRAMSAALKRAGLTPADIDYVNAHGTSTPLGDEIELRAVERLLGNAAATMSMSSTKSLDRPSARRGRRGRGDLLHPGDPRPDRAADAQSRQSRRSRPRSTSCRTTRASAKIDVALSNSFGFGGTNASLIFSGAPDAA